MPWTWVAGERKDLLGALTRDQRFRTGTTDVERELVDSRMVGNDLWTVWQTRVNGFDGGKQLRLDQIDRHPETQRWGHRTVAEGDGRFMPLTCPTELLDLAPVAPNREAAAWRATVRTQALAVGAEPPSLSDTPRIDRAAPRIESSHAIAM